MPLRIKQVLTVYTPTPQIGQIYSDNSSAKASVFDYFVGLLLKGLKLWANAKTNTRTNFECYTGPFYNYFKTIFGILQKFCFYSEEHFVALSSIYDEALFENS